MSTALETNRHYLYDLSANDSFLTAVTMFPGYSGIIQYGHRSFLAIALGFTSLVNAFLIVNFYWTALLTTGQRNILIITLFGIWGALMLIDSFWKHHLGLAIQPEQHDETFRQMISNYLHGDWFASESQILPHLKKYPKDIEVLLLQVSMYRHMERYEEAQLVLDKLQLLKDSRYWQTEIESEQALISEKLANKSAAQPA